MCIDPFYCTIRRPVPISEAWGILGRAVVGCPSNAHLQVWYLSTPIHHLCLLTFFHVRRSIHSRFKNLMHNQQASAHIRSWRQSWEGCSRLSIQCTLSSLVSISSSPSPLYAKLCSICVHRSVYCIISRPVPISGAGGIFGRGVAGCLSDVHHQLWWLSAPLNHLYLLNLVSWVSNDPFKI